MPQTTVEQTFPDGRQARTQVRAVLDKTRYTSADSMQAEWRKIWTRSWLFAGLLSDVAESGDYFVFDIGRESIVVIRGDDGLLRAFYNVCQHRGNRIFSNEAGAVRQVACPYHGWRYALEGQLLEVPDAQRFNPPVSADERSLKPVKLDTWAGMVWITMDPDAEPLASFLGPIIDNLAGYHFENMVLAQHQSVALDANWKTVRDNFLEQYHVDFIHPQHASLVDCCNSENILWPMGHSAALVQGYVTDSRYPLPQQVPEHLLPLLDGLAMDPEAFAGRVDQIRPAVQQQKRLLATELGFDCSDLSDAQLSDIWQYDIFPNTFMTIQAEELWIFGPRPHPTEPDKCLLDKFTLQLPVELGRDEATGITLSPGLAVSVHDQRPEHDCFSGEDVLAGRKSLTITLDQDIELLPDMQAGMHSRGFEHALLNVDEVRLQHFHDWVDEWLQRD